MGSKALLSALHRGRSSMIITSSRNNLPAVCSIQQIHNNACNNQNYTNRPKPHGKELEEQQDTISKAMQSYLQRAKEHQEFMDKQEKEFVFGRRHLANMMGKDPETFTQNDINEAIRYLFPSGLFQPGAKPMMKPPQEIYPRQKAAQFDMTGRPHHPFFYTSIPNFFQLMHEMVGKINKLNEVAGGLSSKDIESSDMTFAGTIWITKEELESQLLETLSDKQYNEWMSCMEKILSHPSRDREVEFIKEYRKLIPKQTRTEDLPPVTLEPDGRRSCFVGLCMKKSARGEVKVTVPGTGKFSINGGSDLDYFGMIQSREAVLAPLQMVGWLGKVDVDAYLTGGDENTSVIFPGESARAGCLRWGIATGIAALGADVERLRLGGYLVRDHRQRERNKPGQDGARAKWTWKKR